MTDDHGRDNLAFDHTIRDISLGGRYMVAKLVEWDTLAFERDPVAKYLPKHAFFSQANSIIYLLVLKHSFETLCNRNKCMAYF